MGKIKLRKADKVFIGLIIIETIFLLITLLFFKTIQISNTCNFWSFLNPLGFHGDVLCGQAFTIISNPLIYQFTDLLILTIVTYIIYLIVNKLKKSKLKK